MNTDVYILCAGRGSRMNKMTDSKPKCLISFLGEPILSRQLSVWRKLGIKNITLITGYRSESLNEFDVRKIHNSEWQTTNMLQSVLLVLDDARSSASDIVIAYSDIVFGRQCVDFLLRPPRSPVVPVNLNWKKLWQTRMQKPELDAESISWDEYDCLMEIGGPVENINSVPGQFMGLLYLPQPHIDPWLMSLSAYLEPLERKHHSTTEFLQYQLDVGERIQAEKVSGGWLEFDSEKDVELYESLSEQGRLKVVSGWQQE